MKIEKIHNCKLAHHLNNLYHYQALGWRKTIMQYFCITVQMTLLRRSYVKMSIYVCFNYVGGMFTANTMSSAVETLGMSLPGHHML